MLQLYKTQRINGTFWLIALLLLLQANNWLVSTVKLNESFSLLSLTNSLLAMFVCFVVVFLVSSLLNNVCNRFQLFPVSSNLPAALSMLFISLLPVFNTIGIWMIIYVLMVLIINKLFKTFQKNKPVPNFFDCFFLFACITILSPQLLLFLPVFFISIFIFNIPKWQYFVLALIGFLMPWLFWFAYLFVTDQLFWFTTYFGAFEFTSTKLGMLKLSDFSITALVFCFLSVLSVLFWTGINHRLHQIQRPVLLFTTLFILFGIIAVVLFISWQWSYLFGLVLPMGILVSFYFFGAKPFLAKLLFLILLGYVLIFPWIQ